MHYDHQGFQVGFLPHTEEWSWNNQVYKSLKDAKDAIDKTVLDARRVDIKVLVLPTWAGRDILPGTAKLFDGSCLWVNTKEGRRKIHIDQIVEDNEPNRAAIEAAHKLRKQGEDLFKKADGALAAIPRLERL